MRRAKRARVSLDEEDDNEEVEAPRQSQKRNTVASTQDIIANESSEDEPADEGTQSRSQPANDQQADDPSFEAYRHGRTNVDIESMQLMVKALIRMALSMESQRSYLRKEEINRKVIRSVSSAWNIFPTVLAKANERLRDTFGMEIVEVQAVDRKSITAISQRRKAPAKKSSAPTRKGWMLVNILDKKWRKGVTIPSRGPELELDAKMFVCLSIIALNQGRCEAQTLQHTLARLEIDSDGSDNLINKLLSHDYLLRIRDDVTSETNYFIGPRGITEIGKEGLVGFVGRFADEGADVPKAIHVVAEEEARPESIDAT